MEFHGENPLHDALTIIQNSTVPEGIQRGVDFEYSLCTLPDDLSIQKSRIPGAGIGVFSTEPIPAKVQLGPYEGIKEEVTETAPDSRYNWQISTKDGRPSHFVSAKDPCCANWMRYVNYTHCEKKQNLAAVQYQGEIYFRTLRPISPGSELLVQYADRPAQNISIAKQIVDPDWNLSTFGESDLEDSKDFQCNGLESGQTLGLSEDSHDPDSSNSSKAKNNHRAVTPAGHHPNMAASEEPAKPCLLRESSCKRVRYVDSSAQDVSIAKQTIDPDRNGCADMESHTEGGISKKCSHISLLRLFCPPEGDNNSNSHFPDLSDDSKSNKNCQAVTSAKLHIGMAASEELTDPCPLPQSSEKNLNDLSMTRDESNNVCPTDVLYQNEETSDLNMKEKMSDCDTDSMPPYRSEENVCQLSQELNPTPTTSLEENVCQLSHKVNTTDTRIIEKIVFPDGCEQNRSPYRKRSQRLARHTALMTRRQRAFKSDDCKSTAIPKANLDENDHHCSSYDGPNRPKNTKLDKKHFCVFCGKPQTKLERHLRTTHTDRTEVIKFLSLTGKEKKSELSKLRHAGDHQHNVDVLKKGQGNLVVKRALKRDGSTPDDFVSCKHCLGYYHKRDLWRHKCYAVDQHTPVP